MGFEVHCNARALRVAVAASAALGGSRILAVNNLYDLTIALVVEEEAPRVVDLEEIGIWVRVTVYLCVSVSLCPPPYLPMVSPYDVSPRLSVVPGVSLYVCLCLYSSLFYSLTYEAWSNHRSRRQSASRLVTTI